MAQAQSKRCSTCNIYYPLNVPFQKCPVCDTTLWSSQEAPDEMWQWEAESRRQNREKQQYHDYVRENFGTTPIDVPTFDVPLTEVVTGKAWTARVIDVYEHKNSRKLLREGELIDVGGSLYEVTGPSFHPKDGSGTKYLLRRYAPDDFFPREWIEEFRGD